MSSLQFFLDLGVTMGILGKSHAPNHLASDSRDQNIARNLAIISEACGGANSVLLTETHEPDRVMTLEDNGLISGIRGARRIDVPASGVFLSRENMLAGNIRTICMPVCDHATMGLQMLDQSKQVLACGMMRATPDRTSGSGSVIESFLNAFRGQGESLVARVTEVNFHVSAGRGPCCFTTPTTRQLAILEEVDDRGGFDSLDEDERQEVARRLSGLILEHGSGVLRAHETDMVAQLEDEAARCIQEWNLPKLRSGGMTLKYSFHKRDTGCTVCCPGPFGSPYFTKEDGKYNLAFFHTGLEIPSRAVW